MMGLHCGECSGRVSLVRCTESAAGANGDVGLSMMPDGGATTCGCSIGG